MSAIIDIIELEKQKAIAVGVKNAEGFTQDEPVFLLRWFGPGSGPDDGDGNYIRIWNPKSTYAQILTGKTEAELAEKDWVDL